MLLTAAITELSYRYVELPIRERRLKESVQALLRSGPGALRRRGSFGVIISCSIALPVFAAFSLVTAEYKANDVQASLDAGEGSVTDVLGALTLSTTPSSVPETTAAPTASDAPTTTAAPTTTTTVAPTTTTTVAVAKKTTIVCTKGSTVKRVTALNPKCPAGYKKKTK